MWEQDFKVYNKIIKIFMRSNMSKQKKVQIFMLTSIIFLMIIWVSKPFFDKANTYDERLIPGSIAYGLLDQNNNIINSGEVIEIDTGVFEATVSIDQYLEEEREYLLIVLVDFIQQEFEINHQKYKSYKFKLNAKDGTNIPIQVKIPSFSKELDYIIIKKPNLSLKELDVEEIVRLQEILGMRFKINNELSKIEYEHNVRTISEGPIDNIFISKNENELQLFTTSSSEESVILSIGNMQETPMDYAVISFLDWQQIKFQDEKLIKFFNVQPKSRQAIPIILPKTESELNFQVIALPSPYKITDNEFSSTEVYGSPRIVVTPK